MKRFGAITGLVLLGAIAVSGCSAGGGGGSGTPGTPVTPATLKSISVTPSGPSIAPATTQQFAAWGRYSNGTMLNITSSATWSSSNPAIATVGVHGLATAGSTTGIAVITALYSGITGSAVLTTSDAVSLSVSPTDPPGIAPGMSIQFAAFGTLANSVIQDLTSHATWTSSDPTVAGISATGLATAVTATGAVTISATFSALTGTSTLSTSPVATISTSPTMTSIALGTSKQFSASGTLMDGNHYDLTTLATWSSSNPAVATISTTGLASSHATGTTLIRATFDGIDSSPVSTLAVTQATLASIAIAPTSTSIVLGAKQQYTATGTFTDTSTQDITATVTWTSSAPAVAVISNVTGSNGLATSKSAGTTFITASSSGITSNSATLTITPAELVFIVVTPSSANILCPATTTSFTAKGTLTDGTTPDLTTTATWSSSDPFIATVSNGVATTTCGKTGFTNITAEVSGVISNTAILNVTFF